MNNVVVDFIEFYQDHEGFLKNHLRRSFSLSDEDLDDIVQVTFVEVWEKFNAGIAFHHPRAVLKKMGSWRARDHKRQILGVRFDRSYVPFKETDTLVHPSSEVEFTFELHLLEEVLSRVENKSYQKLIELHYFQQKSFPEISRELDVSENTLYGQHKRLKQNLKKAFLQHKERNDACYRQPKAT